MDDTSVDHLIERYSMGMAYLAITDQMGPSAQLLAFVNYENVTEESLGIESFDLQAQHDAVVEQIRLDPALGMACESFSGRLKSTMERFVNKVTFNRHDNLNDVLSEKLESRKSNIYVPALLHFNRALACAQGAIKAIDFILPKIPGSNDTTAWEKFYETYTSKPNSSPVAENIRAVVHNAKVFHELGKPGDFAKSGWTDAALKKGIKDVIALQHSIDDRAAKINDACQHLREMSQLVRNSHAQQQVDEWDRTYDMVDTVQNARKDKDDPTKKHWLDDTVEKSVDEYARHQRSKQHQLLMKMVPAHVVAAMNQIATLVDTATHVATTVERYCYKGLVDVSRHYEIVHT
jgi:hypothetical protein